MSLDSGRVPPPFKCAQIIFMKPSPDPDFQKPKLVTNIPFISKVPEKVIGTRVGRHWMNICLDNSCVALKMYSESPEQLSNE